MNTAAAFAQTPSGTSPDEGSKETSIEANRLKGN
jgi:hypothetical protein